MSFRILDEASLLFKAAYHAPSIGIFASITGFGTGVLGLMKVLSVPFAFASAVFGALAGFYTWRVQRRKLQLLEQPDPNSEKQNP